MARLRPSCALRSGPRDGLLATLLTCALVSTMVATPSLAQPNKNEAHKPAKKAEAEPKKKAEAEPKKKAEAEPKKKADEPKKKAEAEPKKKADGSEDEQTTPSKETPKAPPPPSPLTTPPAAPKNAAPARMPDAAPTGAIVVAIGKAAKPHARALARAVYQVAVLRPSIDEGVAQVLSGNPAPKGNEELERHASLVHALGTTKDEEVQRRLAGSLGRDLNARLVVLVSVTAGEPSARLVRLPEENMLGMKLTARKHTPKKGQPSWDWTDATTMMRELTLGAPPPGPRRKKKDAGGTALPSPEPEESEDDGNLLTSPWFWGGLGLVVTVGATVLILSQTALNEPDVVLIDGRVTP